jgi:hypothetical protein
VLASKNQKSIPGRFLPVSFCNFIDERQAHHRLPTLVCFSRFTGGFWLGAASAKFRENGK